MMSLLEGLGLLVGACWSELACSIRAESMGVCVRACVCERRSGAQAMALKILSSTMALCT